MEAMQNRGNTNSVSTPCWTDDNGVIRPWVSLAEAAEHHRIGLRSVRNASKRAHDRGSRSFHTLGVDFYLDPLAVPVKDPEPMSLDDPDFVDEPFLPEDVKPSKPLSLSEQYRLYRSAPKSPAAETRRMFRGTTLLVPGYCRQGLSVPR